MLLYLHGARYDVRGSAHRMRRMHELGFAVLGIDYRGFGRSTNTLPSETLAYEDARAAWDWLARAAPAGAPRYVFGHSLGGAIAVHLAHEVDDEAGLIVEGSFPSIPDVVTTFKWGWLPVSPLITQRFDAAARIGRVGAPVLVVHGSEDQADPARTRPGAVRARQRAQALRAGRRRLAPQHQCGGPAAVPAGAGRAVRVAAGALSAPSSRVRPARRP